MKGPGDWYDPEPPEVVLERMAEGRGPGSPLTDAIADAALAGFLNMRPMQFRQDYAGHPDELAEDLGHAEGKALADWARAHSDEGQGHE